MTLIIIGLVLLMFGGFMMIRNHKVFALRTEILKKCYNYSVSNNSDEPMSWYENMANYSEMIFSFTPLKPKNWLPEEVYRKLY